MQGSTDEVLDMLQDEDLSSDIVESEYFVFMHVMKHFVSQVKIVDRSIPMYGQAENATAIVEGCVQFQIKIVFRKLHEDTGTLFVTFYKDVCDLGRNSRDGGESDLPVGAGVSEKSPSSSIFIFDKRLHSRLRFDIWTAKRAP
ncbi:hypothetical protein DD238_003558 [Peronospora effusa]|uniref:Uncharacterized protein n=1 Tax=Peronospora effusa TaxID=542832 RepID=A0A3M6VI41_9STRA|nr:hypothetical protein DD238_003558 [Peronospora effusa]RQM14594.1 hypothetical protein DD237_004419 [Peronospora effusa]